MASKAKIATNEKKKKLVPKYANLRKELKAVVSDPESSEEDRYEAVLKLQKLPRNSSPTRIRNRCQVTGRPRGYYRKFAMSRIALRDYGLSGQIPGLTKSSW
jgi:small subunit ribosomal protein S14